MLLILALKVSKFAIKFVEVVFLFLNNSVCFINVKSSFANLFFFVTQQALDTVDSGVVVVNFSIQNVDSFVLAVQLIVLSNRRLSKAQ